MKKETIIWGSLILGGVSLFGKLFKRPGQTEKDVQRAIQHSTSQGLWHSYLPLQYKQFADSFYESVRYTAIADNEAKAEKILLAMYNNLDVESLVKAYGRRTTHIFIFPEPPRTLWQTVTSEFSQSRIARINKVWENRGIRYRL